MERGGQEKAKDHEIESVGDGVGRTLRIVLRDEHDEEKNISAGSWKGARPIKAAIDRHSVL